MWLYGSGFPKSMNIGLAIDKKNGVESIDTGIVSPNARPNCDKTNTLYESGTVGKEFTIKKATNEWNGWGTQLKPAYEPIIMARKPVENTIVDNVIQWGVGGINIDECRVGTETISTHNAPKGTFAGGERDRGSDTDSYTEHTGRFPANVIHDGSTEATKDMPDSNGSQGKPFSATDYEEKQTATNFTRGDFNPYNDSGSVSRYFYSAKASSKDRDDGLSINDKNNIHPTVKPVELMQYLVRLVAPKNATILDIFNGSGSTGKAVAFENRERNTNYKYIGIELDPEYCKISESRIDYALNKYKYDIKEQIKENEKKGQLSLFDNFD
jgi:site-specific DNA-methyltransferase (adenine-specific)